MEVTGIAAVISVAAAISGIVLGWSGRSRMLREDTAAEASKDAVLRADMEYIKRGVDDVRLEQRAQGQRFDALAERVTRVEESAKQALQRLDRLDGQGG
ncbi:MULTISPECIES: hypothetical protein [Cohnella]|mgnify:CR=1 FL=1|jgi:hypothetical protein|uniref:hypothetical protein n=1 Tax=Cohnella TaxID=329857 RepID=UPI00035E3126|nr:MULTISPECIES: hypothetical protein [Cohnella]REK64396.1 MAG: hypothetical protein C6P35_12955 [Cohnella sp.]